MRASVSGATIDGVLSARETVMAETPASLATSIRVVSPVPRRAARRGFLTRSDELGTVGDVTANLLAQNPGFAGVKLGELPKFFRYFLPAAFCENDQYTGATRPNAR